MTHQPPRTIPTPQAPFTAPRTSLSPQGHPDYASTQPECGHPRSDAQPPPDAADPRPSRSPLRASRPERHERRVGDMTDVPKGAFRTLRAPNALSATWPMPRTHLPQQIGGTPSHLPRSPSSMERHHHRRRRVKASLTTHHQTCQRLPGSRLPAPGSRLPAPGSRLPAPGLRLLPDGSRPAAPGLRLPACGFRPMAPGLRLPACGFRPMASGLRSPASGPTPGGLQFPASDRPRKATENRSRAMPSPHPIPGASRLASLPVGGDGSGLLLVGCG
jgi:hypothetical protein